MNCCPTCNQPIEPREIYVDTMSNLVVAGGVTAKLRPRSAELMAILATRMPNFTDKETLRSLLCGDHTGETSDNLPQVHICLLRKAIADLPLGIQTEYGSGWRLYWKDQAA